jgi:hypothetical protein
MEINTPIPCRVAACREPLDEGNEWSFYLINDAEGAFDAVMERVDYEWGDMGSSEPQDVRIINLCPGEHALIWRDNGSGAELRMGLMLLVRMGDRQERLKFEFSKLYRKTNLSLVEGLGKPGWQEAAIRVR